MPYFFEMKYLHTLLFLWLSTSTIAQTSPKNVILLIGDGMGLAQISYHLLTYSHTSNFEKMSFIGFSKTEASNSKITDSAAGATAISTGEKTYNGAIGVDSLKRPLVSILELAEQKKLSTGMVTTCAITHATPASFIAHQIHRKMYEAIASDFLKTDIDVVIGGGLDHFDKRQDQQLLSSELEKKGYHVYTSQHKLFTDSYTGKTVALVAPEHLPKMQEGRGNYSENATKKAFAILEQNPNGFFLMIEGSQIDWGGHGNDAEYIKQEMIDFDKTLGVVLEYAQKKGNTLVIVTADHETGGLSLAPKEDNKNENYGDFSPKFSTRGHTGILVPVFSFGIGAQAFSGIYPNTDLFLKIKNALNL